MAFLKKYIQTRFIKSELKKRNTKDKNKKFELSTAKFAFIYFNPTSELSLTSMTVLKKELKNIGIKVYEISFVKSKKIQFSENETKKAFKTFDTNLWGIPKSEDFIKFLSNKADIFFDLTFEDKKTDFLIYSLVNSNLKVSVNNLTTFSNINFYFKETEEKHLSNNFTYILDCLSKITYYES